VARLKAAVRWRKARRVSEVRKGFMANLMDAKVDGW